MKRNYIMLGIVAALTVIALVLVLIGVLTHDEPGLMRACRTTDDRYDYTGDCFDVMLRQSPIEIDIFLEDRVYAMDYTAILEDAVGHVNSRVGFGLLILADDLEDGLCLDGSMICYHPEQARDPDWMDSAGDARHWVMEYDPGDLDVYCTIRTSNTGDTEMEGHVLLHELGHCLGLAHDDYEQSIMRPIQTPTPMGQLPPWISDHDVKILKRVYR